MPASAPRRNRFSLFAWCLLGFAMVLIVLGHSFHMEELAWNHTTAELRHGHELWFSTPDGEEHCVLHLRPPVGEPAWKEGELVKLAYYRSKPQFAVLREDAPPRRSDGLMVWGCFLLVLCVPLAFLVARRKERERAALLRGRPAAPEWRVRRSIVDWLAYAAVGLTLGLACVCAFVVLCCFIMLLCAILYDPDPNGEVISALLGGLFWLLCAAALGGISHALYRRDCRHYGINRE